MSRSPTRKVTMFAPDDVHSLEISGVMDAFYEANRNAGQLLYELCLVAETKDPIRCASGLRIMPDRAIGEAVPAPDTFVVAGSYGVPDRPSAVCWTGSGHKPARRGGTARSAPARFWSAMPA